MDITIDSISKLPSQQKALIVAGIGLVVVALFLYVFPGYLSQRDRLKSLNSQLAQKEHELATYKAIDTELPKFKEELAKLNQKLTDALSKLPNTADIDKFLVDINTLAKSSALNIQTITPRPENPKGFYAEIPVDVRLNGGYHDIATFFDRVGKLTRIVNIMNVSLDASQAAPGKTSLNASFQAVTFRFLPSPGPQAQPGPQTPK